MISADLMTISLHLLNRLKFAVDGCSNTVVVRCGPMLCGPVRRLIRLVFNIYCSLFMSVLSNV